MLARTYACLHLHLSATDERAELRRANGLAFAELSLGPIFICLVTTALHCSTIAVGYVWDDFWGPVGRVKSFCEPKSQVALDRLLQDCS